MTARILKIAGANDSEAIAVVADVLRKGCLAVIPTDTVYGVAAAADCPAAIEKLYAAKVRERGKPIPLLAADAAAVEAFGARMSRGEQCLAETFWPGALTIVLDVRGESEGFRVPDSGLARAILRAAGGVLRVTSANLSGEPPALTAEEACAALGQHVAVIVDGGRSPGGVASSVVSAPGGVLHVFREGAIRAEALRDALRGEARIPGGQGYE